MRVGRTRVRLARGQLSGHKASRWQWMRSVTTSYKLTIFGFHIVPTKSSIQKYPNPTADRLTYTVNEILKNFHDLIV